MERREFIKKSISAGIMVGAGSSIINPGLFASGNPDLVSVNNAAPDVMFDKAIQAMGGIRKFVKPNQKVVINPNIAWDSSPEKASNTNPILVGQIVKRCIEAGAKEVVVFDFTCDNWRKCYKNSLIEKYVKENSGKMAPANTVDYYQEVVVPNGKNLKRVKEHELILESDVFINVPVLKHHGGSQVSIAMKNMMGIVWDRNYWHKNDIDQCIADFASYRKPDLNVVDAYNVLKRNGPVGKSANDIFALNSQIISTDIVAADIASSKLYGLDPKDIPYIMLTKKHQLLP